MQLMTRLHASCLVAATLAFGCCDFPCETIPIVSWGGIPSEKSAELFPLLKECGIDCHLGFYPSDETVVEALDAAEASGIGLMPGCLSLRETPESFVPKIRNHPALAAYFLKDEPESEDIPWLKKAVIRIDSLDHRHPAYVNLYPNWAWNVDEYAGRIGRFASEVDVKFFSFDQYPVLEKDGTLSIRPDWYRNLEEFSAMAKNHSKSFWAFALTESHHLETPEDHIFYPVPTLGQLRLQVFSDLLYGAQGIQYFTFRGMYDRNTLDKTPVFELVKRVNAEIKGLSPVFLGCEVKGTWHLGDSIPSHTSSLTAMPDRRVRSIRSTGDAIVSLIENHGKTFLAVQNRDCALPCIIHVEFQGKTRQILKDGRLERFDNDPVHLDPGDAVIFQL